MRQVAHVCTLLLLLLLGAALVRSSEVDARDVLLPAASLDPEAATAVKILSQQQQQQQLQQDLPQQQQQEDSKFVGDRGTEDNNTTEASHSPEEEAANSVAHEEEGLYAQEEQGHEHAYHGQYREELQERSEEAMDDSGDSYGRSEQWDDKPQHDLPTEHSEQDYAEPSDWQASEEAYTQDDANFGDREDGSYRQDDGNSEDGDAEAAEQEAEAQEWSQEDSTGDDHSQDYVDELFLKPKEEFENVQDYYDLHPTEQPYVTLHGQPVPEAFGTRAWLEERVSGMNVTFISDDPVLMQIDNFLSVDECETLIRIGGNNMQRSALGVEGAYTDERTSSTFWVDIDKQQSLADQRLLMLIEAKIAEITDLPIDNQEQFQVLRYNIGQYYVLHHDYLSEYMKKPCGPRVATFFMYLSDVEDGGGTFFPDLEARVQPRRGRAVLWFNTKSNTLDVDPRTRHAAETVNSGQKWAINKWIHSFDHANNYKRGKLNF